MGINVNGTALSRVNVNSTDIYNVIANDTMVFCRPTSIYGANSGGSVASQYGAYVTVAGENFTGRVTTGRYFAMEFNLPFHLTSINIEFTMPSGKTMFAFEPYGINNGTKTKLISEYFIGTANSPYTWSGDISGYSSYCFLLGFVNSTSNWTAPFKVTVNGCALYLG